MESNYFVSEFGMNPNILSLILGLYIAFILIAGAVSTIFYYLRAVGVYEMSKTAGFKNPWYSFIPFLNVYAVGRLSGVYVKKDGRRSENFGKVMTVLYGIFYLFALSYLFSAFSAVINVAFLVDGMEEAGRNPDFYEIIKLFIPMIVSASIFFILSIVYSIAYYIALWRIYSSFTPESAIIFLILSILLGGVADAIVLFINRKKPICFVAAEAPPQTEYVG